MATFTVSTSDQFKNALQSARGGDKILLKAGDYGHLEMRGTQDSRFVYSGEVTVASADPDNPAVLKSMLLRDVKNLTFDGVKFDLVTTASTDLEVSSFRVDVSSDIKFKNTTFDGDVFKGSNAIEKGYGTGYGLQILRSDDITVEDSTFSSFRVATQFREIKNLVVRNNTFDSVSGDNLKFSMITTGLIEGNHIKNIRANPDSPYHRDMIQFLTNGTDIPSTDVVIRGNILNSGDSEAASQSIFMRNEAVDSQGASRGMYYANFLIEDNVIYNAHSNAIWVRNADGLNIRSNTILHNPASGDGHPVNIPLISIANSSDVDINKNITHKILTSNISGLQNSGNYIVQRVDSLSDNFYDKLFVATDPGASIEALQALPGGAIEKLGVGADLTKFDSRPDALTALALHDVDKGTHLFDARLSAGPGGLTGTSATYRWDFGDGTSASGMKVSHHYLTPGEHEVTLTVISGGKSDDFHFLAKSTDPRLLSLRLSNGNPDDVTAFDAKVTQDGTKIGQSGGIFTLTDKNHFTIDRGDTNHLHGLDEFLLSFDLKRGSTGSDTTGRIIGINNAWSVSLDKSGTPTFDLTNSDGKTYKVVSSTAITDTAWHTVELHFDGAAGKATFYVDGKAAGSDAASGATPAYLYWGPTVGNPYGESFNGNLRNIDIFESAEAAGGSYPEVPSGEDGGGTPPVPAPQPSPGMDVWLIDAGSDRRILKLTDGAVIESIGIASGAYSLEAVPGGGAASVRFKLGGTTKVENTAPFALFGDTSGGKDFHGAPLPSGPQTVTVEAFSGRNASGSKIATKSIDFTFGSSAAAAAAAPDAAYDLVVSGARGRSGAIDLQGATLSDDAFVFVTGTKGVRKVSFWLDDSRAAGAPDQVETKYWHDFAGTSADGHAEAWDTSSVSDGRHTITAEIIAADGSRLLISDSFTIDNII